MVQQLYVERMQQQQYTESTAMQDPLTDSDGDDTRPEDSDRQQYMFIWNNSYEVRERGRQGEGEREREEEKRDIVYVCAFEL